MSIEQATVLQAVERARQAGADEADAWMSSGREFKVTVLDGEIEKLEEANSAVLGLRVFVGQKSSLVYTSDLTEAALASLASEAVELAELATDDEYADLPHGPFEKSDGGLDLGLYDPELFQHDRQTLIEMARRAEAAARDHDPKITNSEGARFSRREGTIALANTRGFADSYRASACSLGASAVADDAEFKKRVGRWQTSGRTLGDLENAEEVGHTAAQKALRQLGARKSATREAPVVWSPEVAVQMLMILSNAASGEARYQGNSFLIDREGERLGSSLLNVSDDATLAGRLGSRPFDGEGVASRHTPLFSEGTFNGFLYDGYSARRAGQSTTANAGRTVQFMQGMTIGVSPSNLIMQGGDSSPDDIVSGVDSGLYLTGLLGSGENLVTGDFSRGATGIWIENGEPAFPVAEINVSGRLQDMLAAIDAVGNDVQIFGALAAPTFRISRMMVSGN